MVTPARLLLLLVCAAFATACATTGKRAEQRLIGKWRYEHGDRSAEYHFRSDGTFTGNVIMERRTVADFTGRWSISDGVIHYEYLSDKKRSIAPGTRDQDKLVSVTREAMVIEARDGSRRTYERVPE